MKIIFGHKAITLAEQDSGSSSVGERTLSDLEC